MIASNKALFVTLICTLCASAAVQGEVLINERFTHYFIAPESVQQIKTELRVNSPVSRGDQVYHGNTEWNIVPNFRWKQSYNQCRITDVSVRLNTTYTLPKLSNKRSAGNGTVDEFDRYYNALLEHEKGHHAFGLEAAREIESLLNNFAPYRSCKELTAQAKHQISEIIKEYQQRNRQYDIDTGFGRTQGAVIR